MSKTILLIIFSLLWTALIFPREKENTNQMPYAEGSTSNYEVVIAYNNIDPNQEAKLTFYISDFKTNAPVENAKIELDITGVDNAKIKILQPIDPGIYEVLVEFPEIKKYNFLVSIMSGETNDLVAINDVDIGVKDVIVKETESKSLFTIIHENLLLIIITVVIIILVAFVFYKIGKIRSSAVNINSDSNTREKEIKI